MHCIAVVITSNIDIYFHMRHVLNISQLLESAAICVDALFLVMYIEMLVKLDHKN